RIAFDAAAIGGGARIDAGVVVAAIALPRRRVALRPRGVEEGVPVDVAGHAAFVDLAVAVVVDVVAADFLRARMHVRVVIVAVLRRREAIAVVVDAAMDVVAVAVLIDAVVAMRIGQASAGVGRFGIAREAIGIVIVAVEVRWNAVAVLVGTLLID